MSAVKTRGAFPRGRAMRAGKFRAKKEIPIPGGMEAKRYREMRGLPEEACQIHSDPETLQRSVTENSLTQAQRVFSWRDWLGLISLEYGQW